MESKTNKTFEQQLIFSFITVLAQFQKEAFAVVARLREEITKRDREIVSKDNLLMAKNTRIAALENQLRRILEENPAFAQGEEKTEGEKVAELYNKSLGL